MEALLFRTRAAVLWLAVGLATTASLLLYVFEPGAAEGLVAGEMEGEALTSGMGFFFAAIGMFSLAMAAMTLFVGNHLNHWVNLIGGVVFGAFGVFAVVTHAAEGDFTAHVALMGVAGAAAFLIAGLGLVGLRQTTLESAVPSTETNRYHRSSTA